MFGEVEALLRARIASIVDCPLDPDFHDARIASLEQAFQTRAHQLLLTADPVTLMARYRDRMRRPGRHAGHGGPEILPEITARVAIPPRPLTVAGRTIHIDTSDFGRVSYDAITNQLRRIFDANA